MRLKKDLPLYLIMALPVVYMVYIWNQLPEKVPMHWNIKGEIDRYGGKMELLLLSILLPLLVYGIFLVIPRIDPKNQLGKMGNKFQRLKVLVTTFMSVLALYIIYSAKHQSFINPNYIVLLIGVLYIIFGNYLKVIRANYFLGIRTPWTLESESVWKATHKLGGKLWFVGGLIIVFLSFILDKSLNFKMFILITAIICIVPIVYSYILFQKEKKHTVEPSFRRRKD